MKSRLREVERVAQGYMATQSETRTSARLSRGLLPRSPPPRAVLFRSFIYGCPGFCCCPRAFCSCGKEGLLSRCGSGSSLWWLLCDTRAQPLWCMALVGSPWTGDGARVARVGGGESSPPGRREARGSLHSRCPALTLHSPLLCSVSLARCLFLNTFKVPA